MVILQGSSHDLCRRGRALVHQHHHGSTLQGIARRGIEILAGIGRPPLGIDDATPIEEQVGHAHRIAQQSSRVVAQIQHEPFQGGLAFLAQLLQGLGGLGGSLGGKLGDPHIANAFVEHARFDTGHLDHLTGQLDLERGIPPFAHQRQRDAGARIAAHQLDCLLQIHTLDGAIIDANDQIAGLDTSALGRRVIQRGHDTDKALIGLHLDAQPSEAS